VVPVVSLVPPPATPPPLNPASGNATVLLDAQPGRTYQVEYRDDGLKTWKALTGAVLSRSGEILFVDDGAVTGSKPAAVKNRFYRIQDISP
jgi:hypothetical protein